MDSDLNKLEQLETLSRRNHIEFSKPNLLGTDYYNIKPEMNNYHNKPQIVDCSESHRVNLREVLESSSDTSIGYSELRRRKTREMLNSDADNKYEFPGMIP